MTHPDDREQFQVESRDSALHMGDDSALFEKSKELLVEADKYRYSYLWTWLGAPIIQVPADIVAMQEIIWRSKPDIIVETGIARGGSLIFFASILQLLGKGKVIGVDIDIRAHNRDTIEKHPMSERITLIEGSSIAAGTLKAVRSEIPDGASVMAVLDSDHSRDHVLSELRAYAPLVTKGQYLIVADTLLGHLDPHQTPTARSKIWYPGDEPLAALHEYLKECDRFVQDEEVNGKMIVSSSPGGYLLCKGT
ncbi:MAG: CmcI family methyltransferase [Rhodomicrobium sp.]